MKKLIFHALALSFIVAQNTRAAETVKEISSGKITIKDDTRNQSGVIYVTQDGRTRNYSLFEGFQEIHLKEDKGVQLLSNEAQSELNKYKKEIQIRKLGFDTADASLSHDGNTISGIKTPFIANVNWKKTVYFSGTEKNGQLQDIKVSAIPSKGSFPSDIDATIVLLGTISFGPQGQAGSIKIDVVKDLSVEGFTDSQSYVAGDMPAPEGTNHAQWEKRAREGAQIDTDLLINQISLPMLVQGLKSGAYNFDDVITKSATASIQNSNDPGLKALMQKVEDDVKATN